jgi:hypothetical protein
MRRLTLDFAGNLANATPQGFEVSFRLLSPWLIAAKIEYLLLVFQMLLNSSS